MNEKQIAKLEELAEKVGEVFLSEADPDKWLGAGLEPNQMDAETRGGRYWDKKNAIQTGTLLARILDLRDHDKRNAGKGLDKPEDDAEKEIKRFEKQASDLINAVQQKTKL